jgi:hypothetical protein
MGMVEPPATLGRTSGDSYSAVIGQHPSGELGKDRIFGEFVHNPIRQEKDRLWNG